jgi:protein tyrosine/serine phosphatase
MPRPILIHCQGGADRTGEASAIYLIDHLGYDREEAAKKALKLRYFHTPLYAPAKTYFIDRYLGEDWARTVYNPCDAGWKHYDQKTHCPNGPQEIASEEFEQ